MQQHVVAVVDDDPAMRMTVENLVTAFGLYAEVYASGAGFLKTARESEAACLVIDIRLEDMTGIELARRLAAIGFNRPVVFIAGCDDESLRREAEELGFVAYLRKPFPAFRLMEALEKIFSDNF